MDSGGWSNLTTGYVVAETEVIATVYSIFEIEWKACMVMSVRGVYK
jgi:hypothetical protein